MGTFRFIHTADIHLDSPMRGLSRYEGAGVDQIRTATRTAFARLIDTAIEEEVAFVIIAGDLYDGDWRDVRTGLYFSAQMGRLAVAGIACYVVYGNHDAESQITRRLTLPDNVHVFSHRKPVTFQIPELRVALHGQSFAKRDITDDLARGYPTPVPGAFNIGILHTALTGDPGHANYAPCTLEELLAKDYQYWALGHVHHGRVLHEYPHIVFAGNLQGRSINETGAKGANLVTVIDGSVSDFATFHCDVVRWARLTIDVAGCERCSEVIERVRTRVAQAIEAEADHRLLACRVELTGTTPLHQELVADQVRLLDEARSVALGIGADAAWVERLITGTRSQPRPATPGGDNVRVDWQGWLEDAWKDPDLAKQLEAELTEFCSKQPSEIRSSTDDPLLKAALDKDYAAVLRGTEPYLVGKLDDPLARP